MLSQLKNPRHHHAPYHVRIQKFFELFLYFNVFVQYEHLFMRDQKRHLFEHFKQLNASFSVVSLYIFNKICILLES